MKSILFSLILITSLVKLHGQIIDPVKWSYSSEMVNENVYRINFIANIDKGWNIYSQTKIEDGPIPTSFHFEKNQEISFIDTVIEPDDVKPKYDDMFEVAVTKFKGNPVFYQIVHCLKKGTVLKGEITYMSCDNSKCLPPKTIEFAVVIE